MKGFAAMDKEKQKQVASLGGRTAHKNGRAHQWTKDEARAAGSKGGKTLLAKYGVDYMSAIGRIGGQNKTGKTKA